MFESFKSWCYQTYILKICQKFFKQSLYRTINPNSVIPRQKNVVAQEISSYFTSFKGVSLLQKKKERLYLRAQVEILIVDMLGKKIHILVFQVWRRVVLLPDYAESSRPIICMIKTNPKTSHLHLQQFLFFWVTLLRILIQQHRSNLDNYNIDKWKTIDLNLSKMITVPSWSLNRDFSQECVDT